MFKAVAVPVLRGLCAAAICALCLAGCGQKGDLFLPDRSTENYTALPQ